MSSDTLANSAAVSDLLYSVQLVHHRICRLIPMLARGTERTR
ncbi:hypothetical protein ACFVFT_39205 [Streptomyces tendae]